MAENADVRRAPVVRDDDPEALIGPPRDRDRRHRPAAQVRTDAASPPRWGEAARRPWAIWSEAMLGSELPAMDGRPAGRPDGGGAAR
ncbi:hypothetical protein Sme01_35700 [Sphaerisporangium melleum]|uniref:Uncharacterized protein n=1 Tax=Sphaerisporangium melleum TaxID=321316 RepID=A0A917RA76_9ACTN|nr:hypothetical protein [Sphaerisporangium melleum]GGK97240.1 hypothetical protein GCM10007964_44350 [Sphaerisporangium melleum]GII71094.1 hypothetical protein Sme01_35700 [Sphaerisporangium melleum]